MTKIVLITECMEKGVGKHVIDLYQNLKQNNDFDIYVLYGASRIEEKYKELVKNEKFIKVDNLERKIGFNDIKSYFEIKKILKQIKPDVVHCHSSKAGLSGRIAAKKAKVKKIIYSPHAYFFLKYKEKSMKRNIFIFAERFLSKHFTNYTITTSKGEDRAFIKNNLDNPNKKILIEHGIVRIDVESEKIVNERNKFNIENNDILIGAMSRFDDQKDPIGTIEIFNRIVEKNPKIKCIYFGNGNLFNEAKEKVLYKDNILLAGETKTPELDLSIMNIYLTASLYEGLPYAMIQALSLGKVIVASDVEGNNDCVEDKQNGYLFDAKNYNQAADKILNLVEDIEQMKKMEKNSLKIFEERFSLKKMMDKYTNLYKGNVIDGE